AIGLLAELAMGGGGSGAEVGQGEATGSRREEAADSGGDGCGCSDHRPTTHTARERATASRLSGSRPERYTVMLHVDAATLAGVDGSDSGADSNGGSAGAGSSGSSSPAANTPNATPPLTLYSHLEDGTRVSAETSRRLACDASVVRVTHAADGSILDLGRKTRTLSPALRRALEIRDGGCRFPGCGLRFTEGHHIVHWENGGETRLSNLVSLCRRHHRAVHEEGFRVQVFSDGRLRFLDRLGWPLPDCAPPSRLGPDPVARLITDHKRRGIDPDEDAPAARYRRRADIPWDLEARAWEAVDG
ncbi:MAG: HNH endonuclease, partial [Gemmatimonadota bacterium]